MTSLHGKIPLGIHEAAKGPENMLFEIQHAMGTYNPDFQGLCNITHIPKDLKPSFFPWVFGVQGCPTFGGFRDGKFLLPYVTIFHAQQLQNGHHAIAVACNHLQGRGGRQKTLMILDSSIPKHGWYICLWLVDSLW